MFKESQGVLHNYDTTASVTMSKAAAADINQTDTQCIPCNEGYSCSLGNDPSPCVAGTYSPVAIPYCIICPPGHYCPAQAFEPTPCPVNTYNSNTGGTSSASCTAVAAGSYAHAGSSISEPCPAGHECSTGTPTVCPIGTYSTEGEDS